MTKQKTPTVRVAAPKRTRCSKDCNEVDKESERHKPRRRRINERHSISEDSHKECGIETPSDIFELSSPSSDDDDNLDMSKMAVWPTTQPFTRSDVRMAANKLRMYEFNVILSPSPYGEEAIILSSAFSVLEYVVDSISFVPKDEKYAQTQLDLILDIILHHLKGCGVEQMLGKFAGVLLYKRAPLPRVIFVPSRRTQQVNPLAVEGPTDGFKNSIVATRLKLLEEGRKFCRQYQQEVLRFVVGGNFGDARSNSRKIQSRWEMTHDVVPKRRRRLTYCVVYLSMKMLQTRTNIDPVLYREHWKHFNK